MTNCEAMTSPTLSRTGQEMFPKKCEISKCHNFLICYPIFIIFEPICREIFTLSFEIMVILDWTSPLIMLIYCLKRIYKNNLEKLKQ